MNFNCFVDNNIDIDTDIFFQRIYYIIKASISTLHNIAKCPELKKIFHDENTVEVRFLSVVLTIII